MDTSRLVSLGDYPVGSQFAVIVAVGSFSPPTNMHIKIMEMGREYVCRERNMPVLGGFMSPVSDAYSKKNLANWRDRVEMCRLAAASTSDWIAVDAWEAQQPAWTPTTRVMESIHDRLLSFYGVSSAVIKMFLVVGSDLLEGMKKSNLWSDSQVSNLFEKNEIIVIERANTVKELDTKDNDTIINDRPIFHIGKDRIHRLLANEGDCEMSSTMVRDRIAKHQSISQLTPPPVCEYIKMMKLFEKGNPK